MIHAYVSIWWCLMNDIIIESREKACVYVHLENKHTRVEMETIVSLYTENIRKLKRGSGGASPPEANGMERSQIKWKLLLFDESDFFLLRPVYFLFCFNKAMLFILSQIKKHVFFVPNQIIKWSGLKRTYNLCIVKEAKLEIHVSGSHR